MVARFFSNAIVRKDIVSPDGVNVDRIKFYISTCIHARYSENGTRVAHRDTG